MDYKCLDPNCPLFDKVESIYKVVTVYKASGPVTEAAKCPSCGVERHCLEHDIPLSEKDIRILKMPSMTKEQKTEMLKKRSHNDYKKNIEERKDGLMGRAMNEMKGKIK